MLHGCSDGAFVRTKGGKASRYGLSRLLTKNGKKVPIHQAPFRAYLWPGDQEVGLMRGLTPRKEKDGKGERRPSGSERLRQRFEGRSRVER